MTDDAECRALRITLLAAVVLASAQALAQTADQPAEEPVAEEPAQEPVAEPMEVHKPKFLNLRFNEDYSYLDGPEGSYEPTFFDPIKNINLGGKWRLSLGGEFRFRVESERDKAFGATARSHDTFQLYRWFLHADLKYGDLFRVFVQGVVAHDEDRDLAPRGIDENLGDLQQLFFDLRFLGEDVPVTVRVGRQELLYGAQRFVSPLEWANTRRRFDGVKIFYQGELWDVDAFWARPVVVQRRQGDRDNEDYDFYGLYATYKGIERHGVDLYFFAIDNEGAPVNPNFKAGDVERYTLGGRFWGYTGGFDYEAEVAGQWGRWAGDTIQAWSVTAAGGYTWDVTCQPRFGLGFDYASGDNDPTDGSVGTFDQMFPLGHKYFGFLDLVGRQNITAINAELSAWVVPKKLKGRLGYHTFWLASRKDALYNAGGAPTRRDPTGNSGREVGHELDVTLGWNIDRHQKMLFGYSHFWHSDVIINTGPSENADLFYVQYQFKF